MSDELRGYPRPLLERPHWISLNGSWDFTFDDDCRYEHPDQVPWERTIQVPFSPETPASGIADTGFHPVCWYRRAAETPELQKGQRLFLHFGAIDYDSTIWVNGHIATSHQGGYTPVTVDVTRFLREEGPQAIVVRAADDPHDLAKPRGKQEWQLEPHGIWYPRTSGIWQTVWMEVVNEMYLDSVHWVSNVERWEISFEARVCGSHHDGLTLCVKLFTDEAVLAEDTYAVVAGEVHRRIALSDPGIDDYRNELLWTPSTPTLIQAELVLRRGHTVVDQARSYTALRSLSVSGDRFLLNGRPYHLAMVLDQGYWPEGGLTAPSDAHLRRDVELAKAMGFNGVRKHQKIEDPRYLYWADTLGLLVWEEMPSAYRFTKDSVQRLTREWMEAINRDRSHPCIVAWVPFNESWGVPDLPDSPAQRHWVQSVYHLTKTIDPTRPVVGNDGWESVATDIIGIHDYDEFPERLAARYGPHALRLFQKERPAGRQLLLGQKHKGQPVMLTEFGGIAFSQDPERTWGYSRAMTAAEFAENYRKLLAVVRPAPLLSGFCYTQFADTYQESNGLLYADRTPKVPIEKIALATRGPRSNREPNWEIYWREQLMSSQRASYVVPAEDRKTGESR
ncbi:MAG: glycoside hydrolase family 2 [Bryobacterales bacterium]|nr:glycoside hydrolase family 2 [Bryobacterales bacterium]